MASKEAQDNEASASLLNSDAHEDTFVASRFEGSCDVHYTSDDSSEAVGNGGGSRFAWTTSFPFVGNDPQRVGGPSLELRDEKPLASRKQRRYRTCTSISLGILAVLGAVNIIGFLVSLPRMLWDDDLDRMLSDWGTPDHEREFLSHWPTDFSQDIIPIPCHSHNDYWRRVPLYDAISVGCISVEADIWLFGDELYIGHDRSSLTRNRTLRNLYLDPIINILEKQNPRTNFTESTNTINGVFDTDPSQSLTLLVDFKMDGPKTWPVLLAQLQPLLDRKYLTEFNGADIISGPVTIVGTGNTPFDLVTTNTTRFIFFDAPLDEMWEKGGSTSDTAPLPRSPAIHQKEHPDGTAELRPQAPSLTSTAAITSSAGAISLARNDTYNAQNSYYASVSFGKSIGRMWRNELSSSQMALIRGHIQGAHRRGLKARYWDLPSWPISFRNHVWDVLVKEGMDILNVDDLKSAARKDWTKSNRWF